MKDFHRNLLKVNMMFSQYNALEKTFLRAGVKVKKNESDCDNIVTCYLATRIHSEKSIVRCQLSVCVKA